MTTRRNFLKNSTMLAAGLGISPLLASAAPTVSHKEETKWAGEYRCNRCRYGMP